MKKSDQIALAKSQYDFLLSIGKIDQLTHDKIVADLETVATPKNNEWGPNEIAQFGVKPKGKGRLSYKGFEVIDQAPENRPAICIFECYDNKNLVCRFGANRNLNGLYFESETKKGVWVLYSTIGFFDLEKKGENGLPINRYGAGYRAQLYVKNLRDGKVKAPYTATCHEVDMNEMADNKADNKADKKADKKANKGGKK